MSLKKHASKLLLGACAAFGIEAQAQEVETPEPVELIQTITGVGEATGNILQDRENQRSFSFKQGFEAQAMPSETLQWKTQQAINVVVSADNIGQLSPVESNMQAPDFYQAEKLAENFPVKPFKKDALDKIPEAWYGAADYITSGSGKFAVVADSTHRSYDLIPENPGRTPVMRGTPGMPSLDSTGIERNFAGADFEFVNDSDELFGVRATWTVDWGKLPRRTG